MERRVVRSGCLAAAIVGIFSAQETSQRFAFFVIEIRNRLRFGKVVAGQYIGPALALFWGIIEARKSFRDVSVYLRAIKDEVAGVPLDRNALQKVKKQYS